MPVVQILAMHSQREAISKSVESPIWELWVIVQVVGRGLGCPESQRLAERMPSGLV